MDFDNMVSAARVNDIKILSSVDDHKIDFRSLIFDKNL